MARGEDTLIAADWFTSEVQMEGTVSGGLGAVSFGISEPLFYLLALLVLLLVTAGVWKLAKLLWAAFSG
jgi:hypothetical protein